MFSLSQVLELAGMKKGNFDARRARDLLSFCPLDARRQEDERDPRPAARNKYTLADAIALDLFEDGIEKRLPADVIDSLLRNLSSQLNDLPEHKGDDLFAPICLFSPIGRGIHWGICTLVEFAVAETRLRRRLRGQGHDEPAQFILLNVSEARRRVIARLEKMSRTTA